MHAEGLEGSGVVMKEVGEHVCLVRGFKPADYACVLSIIYLQRHPLTEAGRFDVDCEPLFAEVVVAGGALRLVRLLQ